MECEKNVRDIILDLKDVGVIERYVMQFLVGCEADRVKVENCFIYSRMDAKRAGRSVASSVGDE